MRWALLLLLLVGCGGGGGDSPAAPPSVRYDTPLYCYYGTDDAQVAQVANHTNCIFDLNWPGDIGSVIRHLQQARDSGIGKAIIAVQSDPRSDFDALQAAGVLSMVIAVYPYDEPDVMGLSAAQVRATAAQIRQAMSGYPELAGARLAVIYGVQGTPGIETFDWVGIDDYGTGVRVPAVNVNHQRIILVPGGANPWREAPEPFKDYVEGHAEVVGVVPFLWVSHQSGLGIRDNGMALRYCQTGKALTGKSGVCPS